jgi:thiamine biosynthesis lipoprotein
MSLGRKRAAVFAVLFVCFFTSGCAGEQMPAQSEYVLGTICTINLYNRGTARVYRNIFARLRAIENEMSANMAGTGVDAINQQAGIGPVTVHEDLIDVIESALRYAELSGGAFDPTVGPLVKLWGIGDDTARVPGDDEIDRALALINWRDVVVDRKARTVFLRKPGMAIDLGAIAKGYAADEAVRIIKKARIPGAIVDLGGNIFAYGEKEGGLPWKVGVQNPQLNRGSYFGILELRNKTIVTSGVYERFLETDDGTRYHHILSVRDGYPVENGLLAVTIIADTSMDADALSTSVFALGYEEGAALIEGLDGVEAIFVFDDMRVRGTSGALTNFTLSDNEFRLDP